MPRFKLEDIEDYYTYYVLILGIPEQIFWEMDISFVSWVAADKTAYENWQAAVHEDNVNRR